MNGWRSVSCALLGILVTVIITLVVTRDKIMTAQEVSTKIQNESPYVQDRRLIQERIDKIPVIEQKVQSIDKKVDRVEHKINLILQSRGIPVPAQEEVR